MRLNSFQPDIRYEPQRTRIRSAERLWPRPQALVRLYVRGARMTGLGTLLLLALPATAGAQDRVDFAGYTWSVRGEPVTVENYMGQEAVRLRSAALVLPDLDFENGTIEFDVATTGHRSFVAVAFRIEGPGDYEHLYLRPHNSGRFDAVQYAPVDNGLSAWQLYPEYNAALDIPTDRWLRVKLVISSSELKVYFDDAGDPALVVDDLKRGRSHGGVELRSSFPNGEPADLYPTAFSNLTIRPDRSPSVFKLTSRSAPPEFVGRWAISPAFPAPEGTIEEIPGGMLEADGWTTALSERSGLVNLARYAGIPAGADRGTVLARVIIDSDREQVKKLNFGFSDRVSIFLNGQIIFSGDDTYRSRSRRYLGAVTIDNDAVYLALQQGENELVVAVTEAFGGWGLVARFEDLDGIRVEPRRPLR